MVHRKSNKTKTHNFVFGVTKFTRSEGSLINGHARPTFVDPLASTLTDKNSETREDTAVARRSW